LSIQGARFAGSTVGFGLVELGKGGKVEEYHKLGVQLGPLVPRVSQPILSKESDSLDPLRLGEGCSRSCGLKTGQFMPTRCLCAIFA
jgi:hypothetical protein